MRVIVQRVKKASCYVNNMLINEIKRGFMLLVSFTEGDNNEIIKKMAQKIVNLRIFEDENDKMNLSIIDVKGEILSISQFTLYANTQKGNRPSFIDCLNPQKAQELYNSFNNYLNSYYQVPTLNGVFGENMCLDIICDGPVTIALEF